MLDPIQTTDDPQHLLDRLGIEVPDAEHALRCASFAGVLFDGMYIRLGLDPADRRLALVAALYHDAGYLRGARDHHRKSFDIVNMALLPGFSRHEQLIAACAARYHGRTLPSIEHAGFGEMEPEELRRTRRVSAIVRLAAACDASHLGAITSVQAIARDDGLTMTAFAATEPAVDRDRLREAAGGFTALTYLPIRVEIVVLPQAPVSEKG